VAVDLGGTNLKVALFNLKYKLIEKQVFNTRQFRTKGVLIKAITNSVRNMLGHNGIGIRQVLGVGLGLPGPIDAQKGIVHFFPNIPGWKEVPLKQLLEKSLCLPVFLDNDANLMALAEYELGAARGSRFAICITLGTGVGGGLVFGGNLSRGKSNATGEIGHMPINEEGPRCNCGGTACLETYIGNDRIAAYARKLFKRDISLEELSRLAKRGDTRAIKVWSDVGRHLGAALVSVVNLLNLDCIVIGGGVANAGKVLFERIKEVIAQQAMRVQAEDVRVFRARLGSDAGLLGAAISVRRKN
jgi:glucokinase